MKRLTLNVILIISISALSLISNQGRSVSGDDLGAYTVEHNTRLEALVKVLPVYPEEALSRGVNGVQVVRIGVSKNGKVEKVKVPPSTNPLFKEAVVTAARQWKFKPITIRWDPGKYAVHRLTFQFFIKDGKGHVELYNPPPHSKAWKQLRGWGVNAALEWREWEEVL